MRTNERAPVAFHAPIAEQIWDLKYRLKDIQGTPIDVTVEDTWARIATDLAKAEKPAKRELFADDFYSALADWQYLPAGRITAGAGSARNVTLFNCFVMGTIPDSMSGIFDMLKEAAMTMQAGGGIGYDFTPLRPKNSPVKGVAADASGPLSFMDVWDAMCRTVMSAGSRRGAMMATMRCDHPDIEDFISAKADPLRLRMFNVSVLATDAFMEAVKNDSDWELAHPVAPLKSVVSDSTDADGKRADGKFLYRTIKARELWNTIIQNTYDHAEPGVIFIDRINRLNNLRYVEEISATNPCGEQALPPYGACLLGSINLAALVRDAFRDNARMDLDRLKVLVFNAVRMMDNVVDVSKFPLPAQLKEALAKRRIGLGVTGLADALIMVGQTYGTDEAANTTKDWLRDVALFAYEASIMLAREKGPFPLFDADKFLEEGTWAAEHLPADMKEELRQHGIRNALLTSIAPTGTISLYAGNVSSGIEPIFAFTFDRKVLQPDGSRTVETVEDFAVAKYREFWEKNLATCTVCDGGPGNDGVCLCGENRNLVFDTSLLPEYFVTTQTLTPEAHVKMQAAAQEWIDNSISKTINVPEDISFEDFKSVYELAYEMGCKGCTTYRPNDVTGSVLSVTEDKPKEAPASALGEAPEKPVRSWHGEVGDALIDLGNGKKFVMAVDYAGSAPYPDTNKTSYHLVGRPAEDDTAADTAFLNPDLLDDQEEWARICTALLKAMTFDLGQDEAKVQFRRVLTNFEIDKATECPPGNRKNFLSALANYPKPKRKVSSSPAFAAPYGGERIEGDPNEPGNDVYSNFSEKIFKSLAEKANDSYEEVVAEMPLAKRPEALPGKVYKVKLGDRHALYITITDVEDSGGRRPFELFIATKDPEHFAWTTALTRMVSAVFRRPHDCSFVVNELKAVFSPNGGGYWRGRYWASEVAAIGQVIEDHMVSIGYGKYNRPEVPEVFVPKGDGTRWDQLVPGDASSFDLGGVSVGAGVMALRSNVGTCPKCFSTNLKVEAGCPTCLDCGHSKCG